MHCLQCSVVDGLRAASTGTVGTCALGEWVSAPGDRHQCRLGPSPGVCLAKGQVHTETYSVPGCSSLLPSGE